METLVISGDETVHRRLEAALHRRGHTVEHCVSLEDARQAYQRARHPLVAAEIQPNTPLLHQVRAFVDPTRSLLLAVAPPNQPEALQAALTADVDEILDQMEDTVLDARLALAEQHLKQRIRPIENHVLLAAIVESSDDAIIGKTLDGNITSWNSGAEHIYGYTAREAIGQPISIIVPPDRTDEIALFLDTIRQGALVDHHETIRVRKDGTRIDISLTHSPIKDVRGTIIGVSTIGRDITERKQVEAALRESQRAMSTLISNLSGLVYRSQNTPDWPFEFVSDGCLILTGYPPQVFLDKDGIAFGTLIHEDDRQAVWDHVQVALAQQRPFTLTYRITTNDGEEKWVWDQGQGVFDAEGQLQAVEGYIADISTLKITQNALNERVKELNCLYAVAGLFAQTSSSLAHILQQTTTFIPPSWQYPDITCARIAFRGQHFTTNNCQETPWRQAADIKVSGETVGTVSVCYLEERPLLYEGPFLKEERRLIDALAKLLGAIAEQKHAEETVAREKNTAQMYLDVAGVMLIVVDRDQRVTLINQKGCDLLGLHEADIIGKNWFDHFIPERMRNTARTLFDRLMQGELQLTEFFENPVLTYDGEERLMTWHSTAIRNEHGETIAILSSGTDITEQRHLEREILEISGREQQRIGRELHDGLGSHLTGLALLCQSLVRRLDKGMPIKKEEMAEVAHLAQDGSQQARLLARGLNPVKLTDQGLQAALQELAMTMQKLSGIPCHYESDADMPTQSSETTLHLYRIVQEAVANALKHAHAQHIWIHLTHTENKITVTVRDDGTGLPETLDVATGIGRHVMEYRARIIGASFRLQNAPGGGTIVTCTLPLDASPLTASRAVHNTL